LNAHSWASREVVARVLIGVPSRFLSDFACVGNSSVANAALIALILGERKGGTMWNPLVAIVTGGEILLTY